MKPQIFAALALTLTSTLAIAQQGNPGAHFIENWDLSGDGKVTREEFVGRTGWWIEEMDRNSDGVVTTDDFGRI